MENETKTLTPVDTAVVQAESLEAFKQGVDTLLAKRSYFISQVLPKLQEGQDYYIIMGRKSLSKGGAEKLTSIYNLTATFERDDKAIEMLSGVKGLVAFVCNLTRNGVIAGQGRGADTLTRNSGDANKTLKMAQKRAYIDAVIRTTGLSDIFTQDIESMDIDAEKDNKTIENNMPILEVEEEIKDKDDEPEVDQSYFDSLFTEDNRPQRPEKKFPEDNAITSKQRSLLVALLEQKISDCEERERRLEMVESMTKSDASEAISELINSTSASY